MRLATMVLGLSFAALALTPAPQAFARERATPVLKRFDIDHDETISLSEAEAAGTANFAILTQGADGTLSLSTLLGRVSRKDLKAVGAASEDRLTEREFKALVARRFRAADAEGDGRLTARELSSPAGRKLMQLLR